MQFIASILAVAAVAYAVAIPDDSSATGASKGATCASGSQISCCTTNSSNSDLLGNVLGGSCTLDNLSLLSCKLKFDRRGFGVGADLTFL